MQIVSFSGGSVPKYKMYELGQAIKAEWVTEAKKVLRRSYKAYVQSLVVTAKKDSVSIALKDDGSADARLAQMAEFGMGPGGIGTSGPYDIRKFLLRSNTKGIKRDKSGNLYLDVPLERRGRNSAISGAPEIERLAGRKMLLKARKLLPHISGVQKGDRLLPGLTGKLKSHHATDALAGTVRLATPTGRTTGYMLWRRASWAARDPQAWQHPGVKARHVMRNVDIAKAIADVF